MQGLKKLRKLAKVVKKIDADSLEQLDIGAIMDLDIGGLVENMEDLYITTKVNERLLLAIADKIGVQVNSDDLNKFVNAIYSDIQKERLKKKEEKDNELLEEVEK